MYVFVEGCEGRGVVRPGPGVITWDLGPETVTGTNGRDRRAYGIDGT